MKLNNMESLNAFMTRNEEVMNAPDGLDLVRFTFVNESAAEAYVDDMGHSNIGFADGIIVICIVPKNVPYQTRLERGRRGIRMTEHLR